MLLIVTKSLMAHQGSQSCIFFWFSCSSIYHTLKCLLAKKDVEPHAQKWRRGENLEWILHGCFRAIHMFLDSRNANYNLKRRQHPKLLCNDPLANFWSIGGSSLEKKTFCPLPYGWPHCAETCLTDEGEREADKGLWRKYFFMPEKIDKT